MPESLYGAHPKKLPVRIKLPSHLDLLRFQHAKVKVGSVVHLAAACMAITHYATLWTDQLWLLLLSRFVLAALLFFITMRLLHVVILQECLHFLKNKFS